MAVDTAKAQNGTRGTPPHCPYPAPLAEKNQTCAFHEREKRVTANSADMILIMILPSTSRDCARPQLETDENRPVVAYYDGWRPQ
eukprot:2223565-Rhodomonas_salina.3